MAFDNSKLLSDRLTVNGSSEISVSTGDNTDTTSASAVLGKSLSISINDASISTAKIADAAISNEKLANATIPMTYTAPITGPATLELGKSGDPIGFNVAQLKILQMVNAVASGYSVVTATIPDDSTIPQVSEGTELCRVSITPKSITSYFYIVGNIYYGCSGVFTQFFGAIFDVTGSATDAIAACYDGRTISQYANMHAVGYYPNTTLTTKTFSLRAGPGSATANNMYINGNSANRIAGGALRTQLTIIEIQS